MVRELDVVEVLTTVVILVILFWLLKCSQLPSLISLLVCPFMIKHKSKSVFIQAAIHEVQRISNTVPLSVFHCTTKNTELMGYSIPKVRYN